VTAKVNRLFRTHLLTVAAEDAAELVDLEDERVAIPFLVFTRHELDAIGRTHRRTETARHALGLTGLGGEHPVSTAPPRRDLPLLLRILHGDLVRIDQVPEGACKSLER